MDSQSTIHDDLRFYKISIEAAAFTFGF